MRRGDARGHLRQRKLEQTRQCCGDDYAPENRASHAARMQDGRRQHTDEENNQIGRREMRVQLYGGAPGFNDYTPLRQSNESDAKRDTLSTTMLDALEHLLEKP